MRVCVLEGGRGWRGCGGVGCGVGLLVGLWDRVVPHEAVGGYGAGYGLSMGLVVELWGKLWGRSWGPGMSLRQLVRL